MRCDPFRFLPDRAAEALGVRRRAPTAQRPTPNAECLQVDALAQDRGARQQLAEAIAHENYDLAHIYAGEAVGMVRRQRPAGEVIQELGDGAERLLRGRFSRLLAEPAQEAQEGQAILADLNNFATGGVSIVANEPAIFMNSFTFFTQPVLLSDVCNSLKPGCSRAQGQQKLRTRRVA